MIAIIITIILAIIYLTIGLLFVNASLHKLSTVYERLLMFFFWIFIIPAALVNEIIVRGNHL